MNKFQFELKRLSLIFVGLLIVVSLFAQSQSITQRNWSHGWGAEKTIGVNTYDMLFPRYGVDSVSSEWFNLCFHSGSLSAYLDKQSDYINYHGSTGGTWANGDAMMFSVQGNSYRMNRIYLDGFRIDSRFMPGVTFYKVNMLYNDLLLDTYQSRLYLRSVPDDDADFVSLAGDMSGWLGGPDIGAYSMPAGSSGMYPKNRSYTLGAVELEAQYNVEDKKTVRYFRTFRHHAYADFGKRRIAGISNDYELVSTDKIYFHVQANGELPMPSNMKKIERRDMVRMYYLFNASRQSGGQEFGFNPAELYNIDYYTASLYFRSPEWNIDKYRLFGLRQPEWTMGVTYGLGRTSGISNFSRNMFDADGQGFEPWVPTGMNHELSYACKLSFDFNTWLRIRYEGYNSLIFYHPTNRRAQHYNDIVYYPSELESAQRYRIQWESGLMYGALLENAVSLEAYYKYKNKFGFQLNIDGTVDGFIQIDGSTVVRPNWQAQLSFDWRPRKFFEIGFTIADYRIPFSLDDMRFFANNYYNGMIYTLSGNFMGRTGGKYHSLQPKLYQPKYIVVDIPMKFAFDRSEISFNTTYKKFYNLWTANYATEPLDNGFYVRGIFIESPADNEYVVGYRSNQSNFILTNTPFYLSNTIKYAYYGNYFFLSASWQSVIYNSVSALMGDDFRATDVMTLSEQSANPNMTKMNQSVAYSNTHQIMPVGIARALIGFNTKHWRAGIVFKYINGHPYTQYAKQHDFEDERVTAYPTTFGGNLLAGEWGQWTDRQFNIDFNLMYRGMTFWDDLYEIQLEAYNLYDFASGLHGNVYNLSEPVFLVTRPRGITLKVKFEI